MKCPFCSTNNEAGELFCTNCGAALNTVNAAAATPVGDGDSPVDGLPETRASSGASGPVGSGGEASSASTLLPGSQLQNGRYVVMKLLGQGGMGAAVLARDTRVSNKRVVIKELLSDETDPAKRQEDVRNFEREVEVVAHLDHPLIPSVTDSFQEGSRYYMVQVYVPGENLEDRLERLGQPLPEKDVLQYASQVLTILDYLSRQQPPIVHRDIKPANIVISNNDHQAHLVDFGIARADEAKKSQRKQTSALGTPGYAPPEQYQGNADGRSDLYALAATMHHLLTNRDPREETPFQYPPVRTLNPALSPETEAVLQRALRLDITERYQNAAAMKHDIDETVQKRFAEDANEDEGLYKRGYTGAAPRVRPSSPQAGDAVRPPRRAWSETGPLSGQRQRQAEFPASERQQQMFEPPRQEWPQPQPEKISEFEPWRTPRRPTNRFAPPPPSQFQPQTPSWASNTALVSLVVLLIVVGLILLLLVFLTSGAGMPGMMRPF